ncbi:MAG: four helix bundle protein [bacterium]
MKKDEFSQMLELRTRHFALDILKLAMELANNPALETFRDKLVRSGAGIGASYWEAFRCEEPDDYQNRIDLCAQNTRETIQWLEVMEHAGLADTQTIFSLLHEARELLEIFTALVEEEKLAG